MAALAGAVKTLGGGIEINTAPGAGTTFRVLLPACGRHAGQPLAAVPVEGRGTATVLVVDDELMVRKLAAAILKEFGYRVLVAATGDEALRIHAEDPNRIDVVLLDMSMPGKNGKVVMDALREQSPDVRVVFMSGFGESEALRVVGGHRFLAFLQKPFDTDSLPAATASVLHPA